MREETRDRYWKNGFPAWYSAGHEATAVIGAPDDVRRDMSLRGYELRKVDEKPYEAPEIYNYYRKDEHYRRDDDDYRIKSTYRYKRNGE